ncbi:MAG TPA: FtsW/RodA/SpoVE family cell cycle protein [Epulopiscium sp.]|nr:FtsW/RodA/SpoVE family cell cycle protein [Candidatus Epulonipiscium sp.]
MSARSSKTKHKTQYQAKHKTQYQAKRKTSKRRSKRGPDLIFLSTLLLILCFGIVMVFSASYYVAMTAHSNRLFFVRRQVTFGLLGLGAMFVVIYFVDYHWLKNRMIVLIGYLGSLSLVVGVMVMGVEKKGAQRWIEIGGITFQPSEIVKVAVIIALSAFIVNNQDKMHKALYICISWTIVGVPAALIARENLSSAIVVGFVGMVIIFVSSKVTWYLPLFGGAGVGFGLYAYNLAMTTDPSEELGWRTLGGILKQYRLNRLRVWKNPWLDPQNGGYQAIQSLYAVGSGGLFGLGIGMGVQKLGFIPEPHNDIIFAVIAEELGLIGAAGIIIAFTILVVRGLIIGIQAQDLFGMLVATGLSTMIGIQVLINVAVNTNTIPTTGMQLPFISYGGTALVVALGSMGIILNISRFANVRKVDGLR